ncbi:Metallo-dependent phosphatase-like protein [Gorgonomyces haynaldii]|nr:Metallo-dependent phosphatase-like protein [Gorgonomyces haynaldii]
MTQPDKQPAEKPPKKQDYLQYLPFALLFLVILVFRYQIDAPTFNKRIVAVGDLHGDLQNARITLEMAGIIDKNMDWIGRDTIFVQTGDIVDRGPDTIALYRLFQKLIVQAKEQGGQVIPLLGNHEVMNLMEDWRYVTQEDIQSFGGYEQRKQDWSQDGWLGKYVRSLKITANVNGTVFFHGGAHPKYAKLGVEEMNKQSDKGVTLSPEEMWHYQLFGGEGPLWYRGYAQDPEASVCPLLQQALVDLNATRMVIGHTPQMNGQILPRCNGRVFVIDVGISRVYGGHSAALEITQDKVYALYRHQRLLIN